MEGFSPPRRCETIHDDLFIRALYLSHADVKALILGFDLLFFGREDADRYKDAIGSKLDLSPGEILLNTSHTHCGPMVGTTWAYATHGLGIAERSYADELEQAIVQAALAAGMTAVGVTTHHPAERLEGAHRIVDSLSELTPAAIVAM